MSRTMGVPYGMSKPPAGVTGVNISSPPSNRKSFATILSISSSVISLPSGLTMRKCIWSLLQLTKYPHPGKAGGTILAVCLPGHNAA